MSRETLSQTRGRIFQSLEMVSASPGKHPRAPRTLWRAAGTQGEETVKPLLGAPSMWRPVGRCLLLQCVERRPSMRGALWCESRVERNSTRARLGAPLRLRPFPVSRGQHTMSDSEEEHFVRRPPSDATDCCLQDFNDDDSEGSFIEKPKKVRSSTPSARLTGSRLPRNPRRLRNPRRAPRPRHPPSHARQPRLLLQRRPRLLRSRATLTRCVCSQRDAKLIQCVGRRRGDGHGWSLDGQGRREEDGQRDVPEGEHRLPPLRLLTRDSSPNSTTSSSDPTHTSAPSRPSRSPCGCTTRPPSRWHFGRLPFSL